MATGVGMGFDLEGLDKALKSADKHLQDLAKQAEVQTKRISDAFSLGATKGIHQMMQELSNVKDGLAELTQQDYKIKLSSNNFGQDVIDEVNRVINYTRAEFERLNKDKVAKFLTPDSYGSVPNVNLDDIKSIQDRLAALSGAQSSGFMGFTQIDDRLRVQINDEIQALNERLKVLQMTTEEFNKMKSSEASKIMQTAQMQVDATNAELQRIEREKQARLDAISAEAKAEQEYQQRMQSIAEQRRQRENSAMQDQLRQYEQSRQQVKELEEVLGTAQHIMGGSSNSRLVEDARATYTSVEEQLRLHKERMQEIERKYPVETTLINQDAANKVFVKQAKDYEEAQEKARKEALTKAQKAEEDAYQLWLARKSAEAGEHKRIEEEKYQATVETIRKQNEAFAAQEAERKRILDLQTQQRETNEQVKSSPERTAYEEQLRAYNRLFDEIDAIEEQRKNKHLAAQQQMSDADEARYNEWLEQKEKEVQKHEEAERKKYNATKEVIARQNAEFREEYKKTTQGALASYNQLYSPQGIKSLNEMKTVLKQLETAQANINRATKEGQRDWKQVGDAIKRVKGDIERTEKEMGKFHSRQKGILDTSGQLARALAAVFSVSAIKGYVNKLMQIRGEFELQQRSLQVLLQNKDEANALWDKTVALAVKSPYTTKQLVTATKQLAAYRIESEKLYETNKMLADVSIGLGVDMNRLILAFGQVKAANFLRGTELRQFSEAGVNMLDELAKRFTMLEGRAVSVGEVFERVSKRMVSFKDVEAVFKTITSEGGTFYQMQEKQSETLKGMMLNLKDSYELMLNDIGKSNEGMLKGFVSMMKTLVDNWRDLAPFINTAGVALTTYFGTGVLKGIAKYSAMILNIWKAHPFIMIASILATAGTLIYNLITATDELSDAMLEVEKNVTESLEESIGLYRKLTDTINDSTKSLDERNEAYEELKTKFKDILPDQQLELEYIQSLKFSYKEAEDAMFAYYNAKAIQQKKDKIESIYEGDFSTDEKELISGLRDRIENSLYITDEDKIKLKAGVAGAVSAVVQDLKSGKIAADFQVIEKEIEDRLFNFSGVKIDATLKDWWGFGTAVSKVFANLKDLAQDAKGYTQAMLSIEGLPFQTYEQQQAYNAMQEHNKEMENAISLYNHLVSLRQKLADNKVDLTSDEWYLNDLNNTLNEINKLSPDVANGIKEIDKSLVSAAEKGSYEFAKSLGVIENALYNIFADKAKTLKGGNEGSNAMLTNFVEGIKANAESKLATPLQQAIISAFDLAIKERDIDQKGKDLLAKLLPDSKQTTEDVRKSVEALLKQFQDEVKKWENATTAGATKLPFVEYLNQFGNTEFKSAISQYLGSTEDLKNLQNNMIPVLEHIYHLLGGDPKKDKKGGEDLLEKRLRVIKEIYEAYKELNKTFDETTSKTGAMEKFGDAFYAAFGKTPEQMGYNLFTAEGVVDAYNKFISTLSKADDITKGNLAKGEFVMELQVEMQQNNDKAFQDQIEQMFSGYELSLELEKLNIPRDVAERLFGVDTFDLSEIRQKLEDELSNLQTKGGRQDQIKAVQKFLDRVVDMEKKAQQEMLKNYSKYLVQAQSERVKILLEQQRMLDEIASLPIGDADKALMRKGVEKEIQKKLQQQAWKDFQDSGMYLRLFENLEGASMQSLDTMEAKLKKLRDSLTELDPTELKEINNQLEKIQELKVEKNPFKGLKEDATTFFEYLKNKKDWERNLADSVGKEEDLKQTIEDEQLAIKEDEKQLAATQKLLGAEDEMVDNLENALNFRKENLKTLLDELEAQKLRTKEERKLLESGENAKASLEDRFKTAADYATGIANSLGSMTESLESVFGMSDGLKDTLQVVQGVGMGLGDMLSGAAGIMSGNPLEMIQGGMQAISGVAKIIGSFNEAYDNKKERKIEKEIKLVERLGKLYERLEKQISAAYSIDTFQAANNAAKDNLEQQNQAIQRMIEAEEDKKDTDHKRIEEWREQIEENLEMLDELEAKRLQELGGIGGEDYYKDAAQSFVDAWLEAFYETGAGLTALEDEFDEVMKNLVKKQVLQRVAGALLQPLLTSIDTAVGNDGIFDEKEFADTMELAKQIFPEFNEKMKQTLEEMGMTDWAGKNAELGSLSAGIQGMSEETADVISSYLNTIRFYVADSNTQLKALVAAQGIDTDTPNPMLSQLLVIAEQTRAIHDLLDSVVVGGHKMGRSGIKVFID